MDADLIGNGVSVRHAAALVANLPQKSRLAWLSMNDHQREMAAWTPEVRLLAAIANQAAVIAWQNGGGKRANKPTPLLPPDERSKGKRTSGGRVLPGRELIRKLERIHRMAQGQEQ